MRTGAGLVAGPIAGSIVPVFAGVLALSSSFAFAADPWADRVVEYNAGLNPAAGRTNPATALGEPTRFTGVAAGFPGAVTPFSPAFEADEIVSIGAGGSLSLAFDEPITDDADNPFGIDLLVFGNSFVFDDINFTDLARVLSSDGGRIEVSADGVDWREIIGVEADGLFPTLGYADTSSYFSSASFVRFSLPAGATGNIEIDGVSDVRAIPAPASVLVITGGLFASMAASRRRRS